MSLKLSEEEIMKFLKTKGDGRKNIANEFERFTNEILPDLIRSKENAVNGNSNVYQMMNATTLSASNSVTRTFNTKLGLLWELIANLSPNVISPEKDFKVKIPEVDVIVLYKENLYYTQLKTQKNTLTGSQAPRTIKELNEFKNHWFVACLDNDSKWTIGDKVNRLVGKEFWSKIGIEYNEILKNLKITINRIEDINK